MIKPGEYIQLLQFFSYDENKYFINNYSRYEQLEEIETCKRLDEIRLLHLKYKKQCDDYNLYPHSDLKEMNAWKENIRHVCNQFKIRVIFIEPKTTEYRNGLHAFYYHEKTNITDLIVFYKNRNKSSTSH